MARILSEIAANRNLQLANEQERQRETHEKHVHTEPGEVSEASEESSSTQHDSMLGEDELNMNQLSKTVYFTFEIKTFWKRRNNIVNIFINTYEFILKKRRQLGKKVCSCLWTLGFRWTRPWLTISLKKF